MVREGVKLELGNPLRTRVGCFELLSPLMSAQAIETAENNLRCRAQPSGSLSDLEVDRR